MANVVVPNYTEPGGAKTVIGGELVVNGTLTIGSGATLTGVPGVAEAVADTEATTVAGVVTAFNGLLAKLRTSGAIAPNPEPEDEPEDETDG